jgi:hypothetical protein
VVASSSVSAMRMPSCSQPSRTLRAAFGDALRASWTAAARDSGARAGRDGRMAVLIEQQDGCCGQWLGRWMLRRLEVDRAGIRVTFVDVCTLPLFSQ